MEKIDVNGPKASPVYAFLKVGAVATNRVQGLQGGFCLYKRMVAFETQERMVLKSLPYSELHISMIS